MAWLSEILEDEKLPAGGAIPYSNNVAFTIVGDAIVKPILNPKGLQNTMVCPHTYLPI